MKKSSEDQSDNMSSFYIVIFSVFLQLISADGDQTNDSPIIGILAQESFIQKPGHNSYIAASYVKYLEAGGARVVPIMINGTEDEYTKIFNSINGILFPGGGVNLTTSGYAKAADIFYKLALEANAKGDYFPVWGTCLGFEKLVLLTSGRRLLSRTNTNGIALPLNFTKESSNCRMFQNFPADLMTSLGNEALTENSHQFSITTKSFSKCEKLKKFFRILSTSTDGENEFVSTMEGFDYPVYATQWHPEKNAFEWTRPYIPHSPSAIRTTFYMVYFFVNEARKNHHKFASDEEVQKALIYNYKPIYTGKKSVFEQKYYFD